MFVILIIFGTIQSAMVNFIDLKTIDSYPTFLWVLAFHHLAAPMTIVGSMVMIYGQNPMLRKFVKQELKEKLGIRTSVGLQ